MLFPTYSFLIFFILTFSLGISLKKQVNLYKPFLLLVNLIFYFFWGLNFLSGLLISIGINYGILWGLKNNSKFSKFWLILGITFNILYLGTFKYYNFFVDSFLAIFDFLPSVSNFQPLEILVPIGVSFYTFRMISHLVDCYRQILA
ncbi:MAG: MBOAT family protein, partial [Planktothrix sp.]